MSPVSRTAPGHPSPERRQVDVRVLLLGLAAGPAGWIGQLVADYAVSSVACARARALGALSGPTFAGEGALLIGVNLSCLALVAVGGSLSCRGWRRTKLEKEGDVHDTLSIGEGRTRFLSLCGMISAVGFAVAILFNTVEPLMVPACWTGAG